MNDKIRDLFRKYTQGTISRDEAVMLRDYVDSMDDSILESYLSDNWNDYKSPVNRNEDAYDNIISHIYNLKSAEKKTASMISLWRSVAAILIVAVFVLSGYVYKMYKAESISINKEYVTSVVQGEHATVVLPDSTIVYLNGGSVLKYSASFGSKNRDIKLSGEAYFEVAHNPKLPFTIQTGKADVVVKGTTFNVYAYPSSSLFEVSLVSGSLEVVIPHGISSERVLIAPNQKVRYDESTGTYNIMSTDLWLETAWKRGDLVFRSESMKSVLKKLEDYYAVTIHISGKIPEDLYTGSFHEEEIAPILKNLQIHCRFGYAKSGNDVYISFNDKKQ